MSKNFPSKSSNYDLKSNIVESSKINNEVLADSSFLPKTKEEVKKILNLDPGEVYNLVSKQKDGDLETRFSFDEEWMEVQEDIYAQKELKKFNEAINKEVIAKPNNFNLEVSNQEFLRLYKKALKEKTPEAYFRLASFRASSGDVDGQIKDLQTLLELDENDNYSKQGKSILMELFHNLGRSIQKKAILENSLNYHEEAVAYFTKIIDLKDPSSVRKWVFHDMGFSNVLLGKKDRALEDFSEEIRVNPNSDSYCERGRLQKDPDLARQDFKEAIRFKSSSYGAKESASYLHKEIENNIKIWNREIKKIKNSATKEIDERRLKETYYDIAEENYKTLIDAGYKLETRDSFGKKIEFSNREDFEKIVENDQNRSLVAQFGSGIDSFVIFLCFAKALLVGLSLLISNKEPNTPAKESDFVDVETGDLNVQRKAKNYLQYNLDNLSEESKEAILLISSFEDASKFFSELVLAKNSENFNSILDQKLADVFKDKESIEKLKTAIKEDILLEEFCGYKEIRKIESGKYKNYPQNHIYNCLLKSPEIYHAPLDKDRFDKAIKEYENQGIATINSFLKDLYQEKAKLMESDQKLYTTPKEEILESIEIEELKSEEYLISELAESKLGKTPSVKSVKKLEEIPDQVRGL